MALVQNPGAFLAAFDISNQTGPSIHNQQPPSMLAFEDHCPLSPLPSAIMNMFLWILKAFSCFFQITWFKSKYPGELGAGPKSSETARHKKQPGAPGPEGGGGKDP